MDGRMTKWITPKGTNEVSFDLSNLIHEVESLTIVSLQSESNHESGSERLTVLCEMSDPFGGPVKTTIEIQLREEYASVTIGGKEKYRRIKNEGQENPYGLTIR